MVLVYALLFKVDLVLNQDAFILKHSSAIFFQNILRKYRNLLVACRSFIHILSKRISWISWIALPFNKVLVAFKTAVNKEELR